MFNEEKFKELCNDTPEKKWQEEARWRVANRDWLRIAGAVSITFFETYGIGEEARMKVKELLNCDDQRVEDVMKGKADLTISEIYKLIGFEKLAELMNEYLLWLKGKNK